MPAGMRVNGSSAPTSPVGHPDVLWGLPGQGGLLTEWSETVPDLTWPESVRTYGRMRRDARLSAILAAYFYPILRTSWAVDPEGIDRSEAVDLVAEDLGLPILGEKGRPKEAAIPGFRWHDHARLALLNLVYGHMPFERWYEVRAGRTHLAGVQERQPHTVSMIDINDDGTVREVMQNTQDEPIPANRLLWYCNGREGANWAGVSLLRSCYTPWVLKHETMRVHATSIRRFGMGVPNVEAPPGATPGQVAQAQQLASQMRVGDTAGAGLPSGFKLNLTGLTGSVPDAIAFLGYLNQEMTTSALAQMLELGHTSYGSRSVGETFLDLFLLSLQSTADAICDTATIGDPGMPGLAKSLVEFNWGEGEPVPRIVAPDVGDRHEITATSISQMVTAGALSPDPNLEAYLREAWGLPERSEDFPPPHPQAPYAPKGMSVDVQPAPPAAPSPAGGGGSEPAQPSPASQTTKASWRKGRSRWWPFRGGGQAAAPEGLRRPLTGIEAAAGMEPLVIQAESDQAVTGLLKQWEPVARAMRQDLAEQVAAAVDGGQLDQLAALHPDVATATTLLTQAMSDMAWTGAQRLVKEAAAQGVVIPLAGVQLDDARIGRVAAARAALIGNRLAHEATRTALRVVTASAGTDAADSVSVSLDGLSQSPLADQLQAAMNAAQNMGRVEAMTAGINDGYVATAFASEILDKNTCFCPEVQVTTVRGQVRADEVTLDDYLLTHAGRWVQPSRITVSEVEEQLVRVGVGGGPLRATADHPVLCYEDGALCWREAGQLAVGDFIVGQASLECGAEIRPPDLVLRETPDGVAVGGEVRRLAAVYVRAEGVPVGTVRFDGQAAEGEVDDPRADLDLCGEVVSGVGQGHSYGALDAGLGTGGPVATHGAMPSPTVVGVLCPEDGTAVRAGELDRRAVTLAAAAAYPGAVDVPVSVGNGNLEVATTPGAGLGGAVTGLGPTLSPRLGVGVLAGNRAVDGPVSLTAGDLAATGLAAGRGPAGRSLLGTPNDCGAGPATRPLLDGPVTVGAGHGLILTQIEAVTWEDYTGYVYDFTVPGDETFWAEGVLVHNCAPCENIDGYQYPSVEEANADYANGGYLECEGLERCRGTLIVTWDAAASSTAEDTATVMEDSSTAGDLATLAGDVASNADVADVAVTATDEGSEYSLGDATLSVMDLGEVAGNPSAIIDSIEVPADLQGQGIAGRLLDEVTRAADESGTTLLLDVEPFGSKAMGADELRQFYAQYGFVPDPSPEAGPDSMIRSPRAVPPKPAQT